MTAHDDAGCPLSGDSGADALRPSPARCDAPTRQGTGSLSVPENVRARLLEGPASGSPLAARLGRRKVEVLAALRALVASGEVRIEGRGPASRYVLGAAPASASAGPIAAELTAVTDPAVAPYVPVPVIVTPCRYCAEDERGGCEFCGGPVPGRRCAHCAEGARQAAAVVG